MLFNVEKCKVMHIGYNNKKGNMKWQSKNLEEADEAKDFVVIMCSELKWNRQCTKALKTANRGLGMVRRSSSYLCNNTTLQLYQTLARPHLECCVQACRPHKAHM
jgi:hypothetical protein